MEISKPKLHQIKSIKKSGRELEVVGVIHICYDKKSLKVDKQRLLSYNRAFSENPDFMNKKFYLFDKGICPYEKEIGGGEQLFIAVCSSGHDSYLVKIKK